MSVIDIDEFEGKPGITPGRPVLTNMNTYETCTENEGDKQSRYPEDSCRK